MDDGIDIDEGKVHSQATGVIVSTGTASDPLDGGNGIDVDSLFESTQGDVRIADGMAIGIDGASTSEITIENSGTLVGRSGTAIEFAPNQGNSSLLLTGNSEIFGDVMLGSGDDQLIIDGLTSTSGKFSTVIFDGGAGTNGISFNDFSLSDILSFEIADVLVYLSLGAASNELFSGNLTNFSSWTFGSEGTFSTKALASQFMNPSVLPYRFLLSDFLDCGQAGHAFWDNSRLGSN